MAGENENRNVSGKVRPLSTVKEGEMVRLVRVEAGRGLASRLASMGIVPKVEFKVVNNHHPGPFLIDVRGYKMMLGRGIAHKLMVS